VRRIVMACRPLPHRHTHNSKPTASASPRLGSFLWGDGFQGAPKTRLTVASAVLAELGHSSFQNRPLGLMQPA
jgi:hypothetical protein